MNEDYIQYLPKCTSEEMFDRIRSDPPITIGKQEVLYYEDDLLQKQYHKNSIRLLKTYAQNSLRFYLKDGSSIHLFIMKPYMMMCFRVKNIKIEKAFIDLIRGYE